MSSFTWIALWIASIHNQFLESFVTSTCSAELFLNQFLASTCSLESIIVSTCSSDWIVHLFNYLTILSRTPVSSRFPNDQFCIFLLYILSNWRLKWSFACIIIFVLFDFFFFLIHDAENSSFDLFTGQYLAMRILIYVQSVKNVGKVFIVFSSHVRSFI